jgi:hypothetical protein
MQLLGTVFGSEAHAPGCDASITLILAAQISFLKIVLPASPGPIGGTSSVGIGAGDGLDVVGGLDVVDRRPEPDVQLDPYLLPRKSNSVICASRSRSI